MLTGGCLCGAIRYQVNAEPSAVYYCHCSKCRRASGSSFATNMVIDDPQNFQITEGESLLGCFQSSSQRQRNFCSQCGSPIFNRAISANQSFVTVRCGTLDSAPDIQPQAHIWVGSKAPWFEICDSLPQYEENPPSK